MPFQARNLLQGTFVNDCRTMSNAELVEKWVYRETPYAFRNAAAAFLEWRNQLAACLGLEPNSICVIGSTAVGLSLSPTKRFETSLAAVGCRFGHNIPAIIPDGLGLVCRKTNRIHVLSRPGERVDG
jgi:hypothetical protein